MISRDDALQLVHNYMDKENLVKHVFAVEAVMRSLAGRIGEDVEIWSITGLLHDLDLKWTEENPERHAYVTCEMLANQLPEEALQAIVVHPGHEPPRTRIDWGLYCSDPVTGLVTAATLTHPSRSLAGLQLKSLKKRFKDKRFAAGASRDQIRSCTRLGLELDDFLELALDAMRTISDDLGL